jgi:Fe-S-cluster-containing dehydrogenase component
MEGMVKPWHGIQREEIRWNPEVDEELCIGCGMCVTGCGRMVYRFDYEKKKPPLTAWSHVSPVQTHARNMLSVFRRSAMFTD